jgi:hypothetical protein
MIVFVFFYFLFIFYLFVLVDPISGNHQRCTLIVKLTSS